jgi:S1-C subfamily serine protease
MDVCESWSMLSTIEYCRRIGWRGALGLALWTLAACARPVESSAPLTTTAPAAIGVQFAGTGFFVDERGHLLTARHTVADCAQMYVVKGGRTVSAELVGQSVAGDLALLKVSETLGVPAVFARTVGVTERDMVFAASYENLQGMLSQGGVLFNAVVADGAPRDREADIVLISDATYGASGAPVLASGGQVIGMITHKVGRDRVLATNVANMKQFLAAHRVAVRQDDRPQLAALQGRASRAATISARVTCFR